MMRRDMLVVLAVLAVLVGASMCAQAADIGLTKGVTPPSPNIYHVGETIHYVMTVENLHPTETIRVDLVEDTLPDGMVVTLDSSANPAYPDFPYELTAGSSQAYMLDWVVPPATDGYVVNDLRCVGVQFSTVQDPFDAHVQKTSLVVNPCIDVTKDVDCGISKVGDEVIYHICVTNCGSVDLVNLSVVDDVMGDISSYFTSTIGAAQTECADIPYVIQGGDPDPLINTVTATAEDVTGFSVDDFDTATVDLIHPGLTVTKECQTITVPSGGDAVYEVVITNTGDCDLVITTDEAAFPGPFTIVAGDDYTDTVTVTDPGGVDCVYNDITVTWTLPAEYCNMQNTGTAYAEACCDVEPPCIAVEKTVDCDISKVGDEVVYHICIANCGNTDLFNIVVMDDLMGDISSYFPTSLTPSQAYCADLPYTIQGGDPDPLINTVTVTGENEAGTQTSDYDTAEVDLIHPSVEVTKTCLIDPVPSGGNAEYEVVITNTGDCDLVITTDEAEIPGPMTIVAGDNYTTTVSRPDPGDVDCIYNDITVTWTLPPEYCNMQNTGTAYAEACCPVEIPGGEGRWTGGGTISWDATIPAGAHVTHGFEFRCNLRNPNRFEVNWGKGQKFHMLDLLECSCYMNPDLPPPDPPEAPINEVYGHGVGRYNNQPDYTIDFYLTDVGEPGENDFARILVTSPGGEIVLQVEGTLEYGNQQAHTDNQAVPPPGFYGASDRSMSEDHDASEIQQPGQDREMIPTEAWSQSIPNPFGESTSIRFGLPQSGAVSIDVFDVAGRHVTSLLNTEQTAGTHEVVWDGRSSDGTQVPAGVYFYRIALGSETLMQKMMVLR